MCGMASKNADFTISHQLQSRITASFWLARFLRPVALTAALCVVLATWSKAIAQNSYYCESGLAWGRDVYDGEWMPTEICMSYNVQYIEILPWHGDGVIDVWMEGVDADLVYVPEMSHFCIVYRLTIHEVGSVTVHADYVDPNAIPPIDCHLRHTYEIREETHVNVCGPYDPEPLQSLTVCPNSTICLQVVGHVPDDAESLSWFYIEGSATFVGSDIGTTVTIQAPNSGWFAIYAPYNHHLFGFIEVSVGSVDLDIDSDNNEGFSENFSRTLTDEPLEDQAGHPGKLVFVNKVDDDGDRVPGFADGLAQKWSGSNGSQAWFTPIVLSVPNPHDGDQIVTFTYNASPPGDVRRDPPAGGSGDPLGNSYTPGNDGRLRLWVRDADQIRSVTEFPVGDYLHTGSAYSMANFADFIDGSGRLILWLEAVRPSEIAGGDTIQVSVQATGANNQTSSCGTNTIRLTACDLEVHDLRHWEPTATPVGISLNDADLWRRDLFQGHD